MTDRQTQCCCKYGDQMTFEYVVKNNKVATPLTIPEILIFLMYKNMIKVMYVGLWRLYMYV